MAYQETEKTRAHKVAQQQLIIASAIDIISKEGFHAMTSRAVSTRAGVSVGKIFHHFADLTELQAQVEAVIMNRDRATIEAAAKAGSGAGAASAALAAMFNCFANTRASREMMKESEAYRDTLTRALGHIIGASGICERNEARNAARAALGALFAMAAGSGAHAARLSTALLFVLRGLGVPERRAAELAS